KYVNQPLPPAAGLQWRIGLDVGISADRFGICCIGKVKGEPDAALAASHPNVYLVMGAVAALDPPRRRGPSEETLEEQQQREKLMFERVWDVIRPYAETPGAMAIADTYKGGPLKQFLQQRGLQTQLLAPGAKLDMQRAVALQQRLEDGTL